MILDPGGANYICQLEDGLDRLKDVVQQLKNKKEGIKIRVKREESPYKKRTYEVIDWLYRAERLEAQAEKVVAKCEEELGKRWRGCCCLINCFSSSKVGKRVGEILEAVNLLVEDNFDLVVERTPHDLVDVIPVKTTVGFESDSDQVWRCLRDESIGIIGIYGMAGVGKTTLLKKIKDELVEKGLDFSDVIWFQQSKRGGLDAAALQDVIRNKLGVADERWKNKNRVDRGIEISRLLGNRKFLLLLDDLRDKVDLLKVGVPLPNGNGSKVVLATRSEAVCNYMKIQIKLKLECLPPEEALKLFWMNVGEDSGNYGHQVEGLARKINTQVCQGLPLALILTGKAMGRLRNSEEWKQATSTIVNDPSTLPGMNRIFHILEASCDDDMEDDNLKDCFSYCSILSKVIRKDELINLWIGEGFLDSSDRNLGEYIIQRLKLSCLLESDELSDSVSMHGVFRAFGLWLARERKTDNWKKATRISMQHHVDLVPTQDLFSPQVRTLFIRDTNFIGQFPTGFVQSMNALEVLDVAGIKILDELLIRNIGALINLHYLNLSYTSIRELPIEMNNLKKLKVLLVDYTENFQIIRRGVVSSLSSLQVFSKLGDGIFYDATLLEELECIENVAAINVSLFSHQAIDKMLNSGKLQSCIRKLMLRKIEGIKLPISTLSRMVQLEELIIQECENLQFETDNTHYYVLNFRGLQIRHCSAINNLQWLIFAPKLQVLDLSHCESLVEVIGNDFKPEEIKEIDERLGIFSNVKRLYLQNLPFLKCICPQILHFPVLKELLVVNCPTLQKLPFDSHCANRLRQIKGSRSWWEQLHWKDEDARAVFYSKFQGHTLKAYLKKMHDVGCLAF